MSKRRKPIVERTTTPQSAVGMEFYEIEGLGATSFCPDSNDASTPAKQVHVTFRMKPPPGVRPSLNLGPRFVMRCHGPDTLDAFIEALIEHRTYVFGRTEYRNDYPVQPSGPHRP